MKLICYRQKLGYITGTLQKYSGRWEVKKHQTKDEEACTAVRASLAAA